MVFLALGAACNSGGGAATPASGAGGAGGRVDGTGGNKPAASGGAGGGNVGNVGSAGMGSVSTGGIGAGGAIAGAGGSSTAPPADAASSTGGASGAGGSPADGPASPAGCTAKLCDDFEGYAAGGPPMGSWTVSTQSAALAVDEKKAFSGARSVRFTHQGAPAKAYIELRQPVLPLPGHVMHGRLMFQLTQGPTGQYTHWEIVRGSGPLASGGRAQYNTGGENGKFVLNYEPNDCTRYSKIDFPQKRWACYQWEFNGPKNEIRMWIDGKPIDDLPPVPAAQCWRAPMVFDTVHIGWQAYHGTQALEIWIDDVAVGDQPIPCPTGMPSKP